MILECLYCGGEFPPAKLKQHTCAACWSRNEKEFGSEWFTQDWHAQLQLDARSEKRKPHGLVGLTKRERNRLVVVGIEHVSNEDVSDVLPCKPRVGRSQISESVQNAVATMLVIENLTPRRIHEKLNKNRFGKKVSLSTIYRLVRQIRKLPLPDMNTVDCQTSNTSVHE